MNDYVFAATDLNPKPDKPAVNPPKSGGGESSACVCVYI